MSTWLNRAWRGARGTFPGLASVFFLTVANAGSQELQLYPHQQLAHDLFRELIEINTVESAGTAPAAEAYTRAIALHPGHVHAHLNLGHLLHEDGEIEAAETHYRQALSANPESALAAFNLGVAGGSGESGRSHRGL